jgi:hypothetical protein
MDPDQAHRQFVKAAYDAAKTLREAKNLKRKLLKMNAKLGEQLINSSIKFI